MALIHNFMYAKDWDIYISGKLFPKLYCLLFKSSDHYIHKEFRKTKTLQLPPQTSDCHFLTNGECSALASSVP